MSDQIFPICVGVWVVLAILGSFFHLSRNAVLKRRYCRPYVVLIGAVFLGFIVSDWGIAGAVLGGSLVALMTYLNIKNVSFCDCGETVWGQVFRWRECCPECGALLPEWR